MFAALASARVLEWNERSGSAALASARVGASHRFCSAFMCACEGIAASLQRSNMPCGAIAV